MSYFPNLGIFDHYRAYKSDAERIETTTARIGLYTFHFYEDGSGATIQRNIYGSVEATWEIRRQEFGSKENLTTYYGTLLTQMTQNCLHQVETTLQILAKAT